MRSMIDEFAKEYGHVYDAATNASVAKMLQILQESASCSFVPRARFEGLARARKKTKTPPGFKDDGDGDYFVWADFLYGLLTSLGEGQRIQHVILLTNDQKPDWSTAGTPHPVLSAEVKALFGAKFHLWNLERFRKEVVKAIG